MSLISLFFIWLAYAAVCFGAEFAAGGFKKRPDFPPGRRVEDRCKEPHDHY